MKTKIRKYMNIAKHDLTIISRALKLIRSFTPNHLLHTFLFALESSLPYYIGLHYSAKIIDELAAGRDIKNLVSYVLMLAGSELILLLASKYSWRRIRVNQIISVQWEEIYLNKKSFSMDFCHIENPEIRTKRQGIVDGRSGGGIGQLMFQVLFLIRNIINFIVASVMIFGLFSAKSEKALDGALAFADSTWATLIIIALIAVIAVYAVRQTNVCDKKRFELIQELPVVQKVLHYYLDEYLDDNKAGKDVRIYNQSEIINISSQKIFSGYTRLLKKITKVNFKRNRLTSIVNTLISGIVYAYVGLRALGGALGAGSLVKYIKVMSDFVWMITGFGYDFVAIHNNCKYLEKWFEYVDIESSMQNGEKAVDTSPDSLHAIEFHNVSFKYPGADVYALKNLSLKIQTGERLAIVGMNGSGKTTMIKLLCRLYDPESGYITLAGVDIKEYDYDQYLKLFSVVFQDFKLFSFSLGRNVAANVEYDDERVKDCLALAGMGERLESFKDGLETPLYKDFDEDGIEISGGEAQKIAIARALYKNSPFVILDEPTAALDPLAEYDIYSKFNEIIGEKSAVYISHRLSSCRFCHKIAVFHEGEIVQLGSHEELLSIQSGKYAELWNAQAQYYANPHLKCV